MGHVCKEEILGLVGFLDRLCEKRVDLFGIAIMDNALELELFFLTEIKLDIFQSCRKQTFFTGNFLKKEK